MQINRSILITGSSSGIGAALARRIAGPGAGLVIHARKSRDALERIAADLTERDARVEMVLGDLADESLASRLVGAALEKFGRLDAVVANAGFPILKSFEEGDVSDIEYAFRGNTFSFLYLARAARPALKAAGGGRIVAVSSFGAHVFRTDMPQFPLSAASKGAIEIAVRSLALAFAPDGITVNCIVPGYVMKDPGTSDALSDEELKRISTNIPLGRPGRPEELAAVIEFLIGPDASYVTGQSIHVNGGLI